MSSDIRVALIKLLAAAGALFALAIACFSQIDRGLVGIFGGLIVLLALPSTILLAIDASRVIKRHHPQGQSLRLMGKMLAIPQAILGTLLMAFGIVYPFFGVKEIIGDVLSGHTATTPLVSTVTAVLMLGVGYRYLREGIGANDKNRR